MCTFSVLACLLSQEHPASFILAITSHKYVRFVRQREWRRWVVYTRCQWQLEPWRRHYVECVYQPKSYPGSSRRPSHFSQQKRSIYAPQPPLILLCILARVLVATPSFILYSSVCSIRNGRSGSVATQRSLCVSISYRPNWHTNCVWRPNSRDGRIICEPIHLRAATAPATLWPPSPKKGNRWSSRSSLQQMIMNPRAIHGNWYQRGLYYNTLLTARGSQD